VVYRTSRPTFRAGDAGAIPRTASVLAAVEALDDRASAPDGGVSQIEVMCMNYHNIHNIM